MMQVASTERRPEGSGTSYLMRQLFEDPDLRGLGVQLSQHDLAEQAALVAESRLDLAAMVIHEDADLLRTLPGPWYRRLRPSDRPPAQPRRTAHP